jgi:DNA-binding NarL/FixJ family response regulator
VYNRTVASERIRVVIADDHPLYRTGLMDTVKRRPELELVGQAEDGAAALDEIRSLEPDVCVLDVKMPGLGGVEVLRTLEREGVEVRVVFVSAYYDSDVVYGALGSGACGYLSKDSTGEEICDALVAAARGRTTLGADVQAAVADRPRGRGPAHDSRRHVGAEHRSRASSRGHHREDAPPARLREARRLGPRCGGGRGDAARHP